MKRIFIFPTIEEAKAFILAEPRDPVFVGGVGMAEIAAATVRAVKAKKPQLAVLAGIAGAYGPELKRGEVVEVAAERVAGLPSRYACRYEATGPELGLPLAEGLTVDRSGGGCQAVRSEGTRAEGTEAEGTGGEEIRTEKITAEGAARPIRGQNLSVAKACTGIIPEADATEIPKVCPGKSPKADAEKNLEADAAKAPASDGTEDMEILQAGADALPLVENMEGAAFFAVCEALGVACCEVRAVSNYVGEPFGRWAVDEAVGNLTETLIQLFGKDE